MSKKAKAAFDFDYPTYLFKDEVDTLHITHFNEGDILPDKLVERLRIKNTEHLDFSDADSSKKEEVISKIDLDNMDKDELERYAKEKYGVNLDKRKSKETLLKEIKSLA